MNPRRTDSKADFKVIGHHGQVFPAPPVPPYAPLTSKAGLGMDDINGAIKTMTAVRIGTSRDRQLRKQSGESSAYFTVSDF